LGGASGREKMNANREDTEIEPRDYNRIVSKAKLAALRMTKSEFEVKPAYVALDYDNKKNDMTFELDDNIKSFMYEEEKAIAFGEISWRFRVRYKKNILLKLKCLYIVIYSDIKDEKENDVRIFLEHIAPSQSYPYFRQRVAQSAADAMVEMPLLPMLKLRAPVKKA